MVTVSKAIFGRIGRGGDLVPAPGGIWSRKTPLFTQVVFPKIPLAKMLGSAAGSVWGTKSPPLGDQIPFLQHIYIYKAHVQYIYIYTYIYNLFIHTYTCMNTGICV